MQEVISEPTNKYPDVFVRNLAQKHMEDKQVDQMIDSSLNNTDRRYLRFTYEMVLMTYWKLQAFNDPIDSMSSGEKTLSSAIGNFFFSDFNECGSVLLLVA